MLRRSLWFWLTLTLVCRAQSPIGEKSFTWTPPAGWQVQSYANQFFKMAILPGQASIQVIQEESDQALPAYAVANEQVLKRTIKGLRVKSKAFFQTAAGLQGIKLVTGSKQQAGWLNQTFYLFPGPANTKFTFTCSCMAAQASRYGPLFDKAMRTFRLK